MTITLDLPSKLVSELAAEATQQGLSLSEYALRILSAAGRGSTSQPKTGAELVAYWMAEGLVGTRSDIEDSGAYAREIRRKAERRERS